MQFYFILGFFVCFVFLQLLEEEGLDAVLSGAIIIEKEPPPVIGSEEKKPVLTLEELEAKQGE